MMLIKADRFTLIGDPHLNSVPPVSRIDDYMSTSISKLLNVRDVMVACGSTIMIILGDVFHKKYQSTAYLYRVLGAFKEIADSGIKVFSIVGNHDLSFERMDSLSSNPLGLLFQTGYINHLTELTLETPFNYQVYIRGFDYPLTIEQAPIDLPHRIRVAIIHRYFDTPGDAYSISLQDLDTLEYHVYALGHDHVYYPYERFGKRLVIRPGSLLRGTSHSYNLERDVVVETVGFRISNEKPSVYVQTHKLDVRPSSEVFSQTVFSKNQSPATLLKDISLQVDDLIQQMDEGTSGGSIYSYLDTMDIKPRVKSCIEGALQEKGIYRPSNLVS